jgi:virginiamycin A acetyltransferase
MEEFHLDCVVGFGAVLVSGMSRVGSKCHISDYSIIGYSHIGNNVSISSKVSLIAGRYQHNFSDPTKGVLNDPSFECLEIGDGVFFGEGCICMADVGAGSIVGAGSVVVKNIPAYSIAVGNPARVAKTRRPDGPWTAVPRDKN